MKAYLYEVTTDKGPLKQTIIAPTTDKAEELLRGKWGPDSKPVFMKELYIYGTVCKECQD